LGSSSQKKMTKDQKPKYRAREQETKSWVYDLIKGDEEVVFVAEYLLYAHFLP